jgi:Uma2 family endonuclease
MAFREKLYNLQAFEEFIARPENRDRLFELVHGEIVEKMPTQKHGVINGRIIGELYLYSKIHGGYVAPEVRHQMPGDEHNARLPDISFYVILDEPLIERGAVPRMPDLAIEVKSPDDSLKELREKAHYYLANGARMVWLVITEKRLIEIYTADDEQVLTEQDILDGGDVLPGFSILTSDIFPD